MRPEQENLFGGSVFGDAPISLWYTIGTLSEREKGTEMGYYVRIEEAASNFKIKKERFERGYEIMCDLNKLAYRSSSTEIAVSP